MKPVKITDRNIMFTQPMDEYSLNLGLILGKTRNYLIDTGLGSGSVQPVLDYLGGDKKPVVVINTHCHWDHIFGNFVFENSLIVAHPLCRELIATHWNGVRADFAVYVDGEARLCLPNLVFEREMHFADDGVRVFHSPGHSADCVSVYDKREKVLYAGDNIGDTADAIVPHIDTDIETFRRLIAQYKAIDFGVCVSGHNDPQGANIARMMEQALDGSWQRQIRELGIPGK